jgi:hypothetical protein
METTVRITTFLTCILIYIYIFNKGEKTIYFLQEKFNLSGIPLLILLMLQIFGLFLFFWVYLPKKIIDYIL